MPKYELTPNVDIIAGNSAPMPFAFSEDQIAAREMALLGGRCFLRRTRRLG
jgi:hypothetical protein